MPIVCCFRHAPRRKYTVYCEGAGMALRDVFEALAVRTGLQRHYKADPRRRMRGKRLQQITFEVVTQLDTAEFVQNNTTVVLKRRPWY